MNVNPGECFAMVDIGHEKTSVCIIRDGLLRLFRSINLGGRYITEFLARDLETSFTEAQRIKHDISKVFGSEDRAKVMLLTSASLLNGQLLQQTQLSKSSSHQIRFQNLGKRTFKPHFYFGWSIAYTQYR